MPCLSIITLVYASGKQIKCTKRKTLLATDPRYFGIFLCFKDFRGLCLWDETLPASGPLDSKPFTLREIQVTLWSAFQPGTEKYLVFDHACALVYWTSWWHIEQRSLRPGNAWETITLFERSHVRVISSRRYPGHWWKLCRRLSSFGDLMWRSRELDDDNRDRFRRSSKHRPIDFKLWFVAPRSSHHTSRRGFRLGLGFSFWIWTVLCSFTLGKIWRAYFIFQSCCRWKSITII